MNKTVFLIGTRWFGVLGPMELLIQDLAMSNVKVYVFGQKDEHYQKYFKGNCQLIQLRMKRKYLSFLSDILDLIKIQFYILKYRPTIVHSFNPKPGLLTFFSVLLHSKIKYIFCITGLGNTFVKKGFLQLLFIQLFRLAGKRADEIFFLNNDDLDFFRKKKIGSENEYDIFLGAGVNLNHFIQKKYEIEKNKTQVICVSRLIWQKGIREFCVCAEKLKAEGHDVDFLLIGEYDREHPDRVMKQDLKPYIDSSIIKHIEWTDNISKYYSESDINFLHSAREGGPRTILESAAIGIPSLGSKRPGVQDLIIDGKTGFLSPFQDIEHIVGCLRILIKSKKLQIELGQNARNLIAEPLSLRNATNAQSKLYYLTNLLSK